MCTGSFFCYVCKPSNNVLRMIFVSFVIVHCIVTLKFYYPSKGVVVVVWIPLKLHPRWIQHFLFCGVIALRSVEKGGRGRSIRLKITDSQVLPPRKLGPSLPQVYSNAAAAAALLPFNIDSTQILSWPLIPQQLFKPTLAVLRSISFCQVHF